MKTFYLYTTDGCGFCQRAKELLERRKLNFIMLDLDREHPTLVQLKQEMGWGTVPMVFQIDERDHRFIGGYTDLLEYLGEENE